MNELEPHISRITNKLQLLIKQQDQLRREAERKDAEIRNLELALKSSLEQQSQLEEKVNILQASHGSMDEKSKKNFEKKINQYLKDIDQVIVHLNG